MAFAFRLRIIFERGSIVQNGMVVHELNIAGLKPHHQIEVRIVCELVQEIERLSLSRSERRNTRKASC